MHEHLGSLRLNTPLVNTNAGDLAEIHIVKKMKLFDALLNLKESSQNVVTKSRLELKRRRSTKYVPRSKQRKSWFSSRSIVADGNDGVSFATNEDGSIKEEFCSIPHTRTLSDEENAECWWTDEEFESTSCEAVQIVHKYSNNMDFQDAAKQLLAHCCGRTGESSLSMFARHRVWGILVAGKSRGLEFEILTMLKHRQARATSTVLQTQERIRHQLTWTQRSHLLALQYRRASAYSSVWARMIAMGDEMHSK